MELPVVEQSCCPPVFGAALDADTAAQTSEVFKALADPVRLQLLHQIAASGEACVCDLPGVVDRSQATVSHHLGILARAGLLTREQRGKWAWYRVERARLAEVADAVALG